MTAMTGIREISLYCFGFFVLRFAYIFVSQVLSNEIKSCIQAVSPSVYIGFLMNYVSLSIVSWYLCIKAQLASKIVTSFRTWL